MANSDMVRGMEKIINEVSTLIVMHSLTLQFHDLHSGVVGAVSHKGHPCLLQLLHMLRIHLVTMSVSLLYKVVAASYLTTLVQLP